jgi:hypothetical protein
MKTINQNSDLYKNTSIKELEAMGITNNYKAHVLPVQKLTLFQIALSKGLI